MYVSFLALNDLVFWHEGRLFSNGVGAFAVLVAAQVVAGVMGVALGAATRTLVQQR